MLRYSTPSRVASRLEVSISLDVSLGRDAQTCRLLHPIDLARRRVHQVDPDRFAQSVDGAGFSQAVQLTRCHS